MTSGSHGLRRYLKTITKLSAIVGALIAAVSVLRWLTYPPVEAPSDTDPWPALGEEYDAAT